jgi:putative ABC transport system permease protein
MAQSVRERISELAVLKTLGFSNVRVLAIVLAESLVLAGVGGGLGLLLGWGLIEAVSDNPMVVGLLPVLYVPARDLLIGVGLAALLGVVSGAIPAAQAMRLRIADGLRRS